MDQDQIRRLLEELHSGRIQVDEAWDQLKALPFEDIGFAKIDTHRAMRRGFPEVIYCEGKTIHQIQEIVKRMIPKNRIILGMRASEDVHKALKKVTDKVVYHKDARAFSIGKKPKPRAAGTILVVSAGTADIPVSEEAAITAEMMGNRVERLFDVGVAGVHRLLGHKENLFRASVIIVAAGMEGALPSVVGGLVDKPVIAVPTSIGYGVSFGGLSALLTMLNTCVPGLAVVNIDNGFGAGYMASLINRLTIPQESNKKSNK